MNSPSSSLSPATRSALISAYEPGITDSNSHPAIVIGTVKGPGKDGNQYVFITADNRYVRIGEFVYYEVDGAEAEATPSRLRVLGKISDRCLIEHLPDRIFADTEISPEAVAALIGFTYTNPELYEVTVDVVGYFDLRLGFMNPRKVPDPGAKVYLAPDGMLQQVLNRRQPGEVGSARMGSLLLREDGQVTIALDVKELVSTHMAILAGTGSGKSYTAGVLVEELLQPYNRAAVLIFDPHGEYGTLEDMRGHPAFQGSDGYQPKVNLLTPDDIRIRLSSLNYYDVLTLLPDMSDRQQAILSKAFSNLELSLRKASRKEWSVQDLLREVWNADCQVDAEGNEKTGSSAPALEWKLARLERSDYFHPFEHLPPRKLFEPGQVTILQMNEIAQEEQQVICAAVLRQANHARMNTQKNKLQPTDENYLPYPVFLILEEAHRFAPAHEPSRCKQVLRTILSEGRKFGMGVGLITQRPGKLDSDILSQCMSQFIMRIVNPADQDSLKYGVEAAGRDLLKELPALTKGQVIIAGACVNTPVLCKVRQRYTRHGGDTLNAPEIWQKHFQPHRQIEQAAAQAPLKPRDRAQKFGGLSIE